MMKESKYFILIVIFISIQLDTVARNSKGCGLIQITVVIDNNCNGVFENGDQGTSGIQVTLSGPNINHITHGSNHYGHAFFNNLEAGSYTSSVSPPVGYSVLNPKETINLQTNGIATLTYFLCKECSPNFIITQRPMKDGCCPFGITMIASGDYDILSANWSNGTNGPIAATTSSGTYSVAIRYRCNGSIQATSISTDVNLYTGGLPNVSYVTNSVTPSNPFVVLDNNFQLNERGAYNANEYALRIFDRWGNLVFEKNRKDCNGLYNGEIKWEGYSTSGSSLQQGQYVGYLVLENCQYQCNNDNWSQNFLNGLLGRCKENIERFNLFLLP